jgi:uncharacterized repeat protein (TIGR04138 family)
LTRPMSNPAHSIAQLLKKDRRYKVEAYAFLFEALSYAQQSLGLGAESASEPPPEEKPARKKKGSTETERPERHLTGQQLCEAIRLYALEQFGLMAKCVLNTWGVHRTGDFGEIVYNLIRIGQMKKTKDDRREDFDDVFDFEEGLRRSFKIKPPE